MPIISKMVGDRDSVTIEQYTYRKWHLGNQMVT